MLKKNGIVDQDVTLSIRDGRATIPVDASHKRKIKGLILDESATGKTAYIEPAEIVELNNDIKETDFVKKLKDNGILIIGMGSNKLRIVTHLDYTDLMHEKVLKILKNII